MFHSRILIPDNVAPSDPKKIQEIAYPRALLRSGPYDCRDQDDKYNVSVSSDYMFNNATKQDRYKAMKKPFKPAEPQEALKAAAEAFRVDLVSNAGSPDPTQQIGPVPTNPSVLPPNAGDKYNTHFAPR
jgi:hypothetical protein